MKKKKWYFSLGVQQTMFGIPVIVNYCEPEKTGEIKRLLIKGNKHFLGAIESLFEIKDLKSGTTIKWVPDAGGAYIVIHISRKAIEGGSGEVVLVHELSHAVDMIFDHIGQKETGESITEIRAYLMDYMYSFFIGYFK